MPDIYLPVDFRHAALLLQLASWSAVFSALRYDIMYFADADYATFHAFDAFQKARYALPFAAPDSSPARDATLYYIGTPLKAVIFSILG